MLAASWPARSGRLAGLAGWRGGRPAWPAGRPAGRLGPVRHHPSISSKSLVFLFFLEFPKVFNVWQCLEESSMLQCFVVCLFSIQN